MKREKLVFRLFWIGVILTFYFSGVAIGILATISGLLVIAFFSRRGSMVGEGGGEPTELRMEITDDGIDDYTLRKHAGLTRVEI